jgi:L-alanine-DL-glutamate epimerase-like enolase superfamily enzyme
MGTVSITAVDSVPLRVPSADDTRRNFDPSFEVLVVRVHTDAGLVGLAECNHAAMPAKLILDSDTVGGSLLGRDPEDRETLMAGLWERNASSYRRGLGLAVLHAIDVCLWDLVAQVRQEPLWRVLWGDTAAAPEPYVTLYTGPGTYRESVRTLEQQVERAMALGYRTAKVEPLADCVPEDSICDFVAHARKLLGDDIDLYVDFSHRFRDAEEAARWIHAIADQRPALVETPMHTDDVWEYARLAELVDVPLAASELYESRWEFRALLDVGQVDVVQPWANRMGVTATLDVAKLARERGRRSILAGWNTTPIGVMTGLHIAAGLGAGVVVEHAPDEIYGFPLRAVASPDPQVIDGFMSLPDTAGLGVALDDDALHRFQV